MVEVTFGLVFLTGLYVGITPCILLMLSAFGTSLILTEDKGKFIKISFGLISGMIFTYVVISILLINFLEILEDINFIIKYFFAGILIFIGIWQIIESKKEQSRIFSTPEKVKTMLKDFIEKKTGFYAFLVGIIFVLIKIPCFGLIYITLLESLFTNPLIFFFIVVYLTGMIIPIVLILVLLRLGLESTKVNEWRLKYRTYLRILNGVILIFLAMYLLLF
ncbi:MAG: cytochrome c biogenesis CcdA family protein [Candidatus Thorarchaeota archaeon]